LGCEIPPAFLLEDATVDLVVPEDLEFLTLSVIVGARDGDDGALIARIPDVLDEPLPGAQVNEFTAFRCALGEGVGSCSDQVVAAIRPEGVSTDETLRGFDR
jgi:hypothetical protein